MTDVSGKNQIGINFVRFINFAGKHGKTLIAHLICGKLRPEKCPAPPHGRAGRDKLNTMNL